jgi:hypothetical protein
MGNLPNDARKTLPEFQEFLVKKSLAPEKNVMLIFRGIQKDTGCPIKNFGHDDKDVVCDVTTDRISKCLSSFL